MQPASAVLPAGATRRSGARLQARRKELAAGDGGRKCRALGLRTALRNGCRGADMHGRGLSVSLSPLRGIHEGRRNACSPAAHCSALPVPAGPCAAAAAPDDMLPAPSGIGGGSASAAHTCRICWEEGDASPGGALLTGVCACAGSLGHIHARCLLDWRRRSAAPGTCTTCRAPLVLPPGLVTRVRLEPLWLGELRGEAGRLRTAPVPTLLRWWNHLIVSAGTIR